MIENKDAFQVISSKRTIIAIFVLLFVATLIDGLDASIVNVSLPVITEFFGITVQDGSWVLNAYVIGISAFLIAFAKIADSGRLMSVFVVGVVIFTLFSVVCGLCGMIEDFGVSKEAGFYIMAISRFIQGLGGSMMGAVCPIIIVRLLPKNMKGRGMAVLAAASGVALVLGPALGGIMTSALGWPSIFFINIPIGVFLLIFGIWILPRTDRCIPKLRLDTPSVVSLAIVIISALLFLENCTSPDLPLYIMVVLAVIFFISLIYLVHRVKSKPDIPLLEAGMFRNREFLLVSFSFLLTTMMAAGTQYLLPFFLSHTEAPFTMGADEMGMYITISSVFTIIASIIAGRWCDSRGCKKPTVLAVILRILFSGIFIFMIPAWGILPLILVLIFMGLSFGLSGTSQPTRMIHHTKPEYQGEASTFMLVVNYLGSAFGNVAYAILFGFGACANGVPFDQLPPDAIINGFHLAAILGVVLSVMALICTLVVRNIVPEKTEDESLSE